MLKTNFFQNFQSTKPNKLPNFQEESSHLQIHSAITQPSSLALLPSSESVLSSSCRRCRSHRRVLHQRFRVGLLWLKFFTTAMFKKINNNSWFALAPSSRWKSNNIDLLDFPYLFWDHLEFIMLLRFLEAVHQRDRCSGNRCYRLIFVYWFTCQIPTVQTRKNHLEELRLPENAFFSVQSTGPPTPTIWSCSRSQWSC